MTVPRPSRLAWLVITALCSATFVAPAADSPTSYGEAAKVDTPILRIPFMKKRPTIDGVRAAGEWEDSSALSGFWYDYGQADFRFMAPMQTQLQVYAGYDKENLYICFDTPIYPENSWLKARGRYPDVLGHPLYGLQWDDHLELELRPYDDIAKGFMLGLFRWDVNPINTFTDWHWSQNGGQQMKWKSNAEIRTQADGKRWVIEFALPLASFQYGNYADPERNPTPVQVPPPDGTIYRTWLVRGIGGNGKFFNAFDNHVWNTTKTQLIFDSQAPSIQINELGPIMEDTIDMTLTLKNHNTRSETVRVGFFVESAEGLIYSSYDDPELNEGLVELAPGEVKELNLKQPFPGISTDGNVLWFDVRSAGTPAKVLFRTRLIQFHAMDGGVVGDESFKARRVDVIEELRPPRLDFEMYHDFSAYTKRLSVVLDKGIHGASEEAKRAVEAKILVMKDNEDEDEIAEVRVPFQGNFAATIVDLPDLVDGESYLFNVLLFDDKKRIVGERNPDPFTYAVQPWMNNQIGLTDTVWEPFTPIAVAGNTLQTLKHTIVLDPSGLPAQIVIKPDDRELPLEARGKGLDQAALLAMGRGEQFRKPMRLEAIVDGKRVPATVVEAAKAIRTWKSEVEYQSKLQIGPLPATLTVQYDCDGSMRCTLDYGSDATVKIDGLELVSDVAGMVDLGFSETGQGSMAAADKWEIALSMTEGNIWNSADTQMELFYNKFVPYFWFGSSDRGWTFYCDTDSGWVLDREGSTIDLDRDANMDVTWRIRFVNHSAEINGSHQIAFSILTHPAKPKPADFRAMGWHYFTGTSWADGYMNEPIILTEKYLINKWKTAALAPRDTPDDQRLTYRNDKPPFHRYGQWRNVDVTPRLDQAWEDKGTYYFEQHVRIGRRQGWWMDEYFPVVFGRSDSLATGAARLRDPAEVQDDELPWHRGFLTQHMRNHYKRMARVFADNNVPNRQHTWSNNAATMLEPFIWNSLLVEECGAQHRSYEVDVMTQFPNSLFRYMSKSYTGLVTTQCADLSPIVAGDDKRLDRQIFARALLMDFGVTPHGPHGIIHNNEQGIRLLNRLQEFGFFDDADIEKLPFWRNSDTVALSDTDDVYVTIYRRPLDGGGYKAIFVIVNEKLEDTEVTLTIADPARLGGANTLTRSAALDRQEVPNAFADWWQRLEQKDGAATVLLDLEHGRTASRQPGDAEAYGPIHVPYHDYRVYYAEFAN